MADRVGQQLGNYRLVRLLGVGGFAEVYLGEHVYLGTSAAIKVLRAQLAEEDVDHFRSESRTIARLAHPNIVRVLDFGVADTTPYLVVDYAPNGTLRKRHPKGSPPSLPTIVTYVTQVAAALHYAHGQKIIHRDVKPENMLLGRDNEVLLSDFGIALVAQSTRYHSTQGAQDLAGTIAYMAPEQIQANACANSDQYSLGVVVYEWLSGTRPFQGSFAEIAVKHTLATPPSLREKVPTIPPAIEEVVMKALAKDPAQRFENVREFAIALQQAYLQAPAITVHLSDTPLSEERPVSPLETRQLPDQDENAAALLTMPAQVTSQPPSVITPATPTPTASLQTPVLAEEQPLASTLRRRVPRRRVLQGLAGLAALGIAGGGLALWLHEQVTVGLPGNTPVANSEGTALYIFRGHTSWVWSAEWSPSLPASPAGHVLRIASASGDGTAQVWDATSGDHLTAYYGHKDSVYTVSWSPNGTRIASGGNDKTVQVWDATYGDHFLSYQGHTGTVWSVAWSPDNTRIASAGGDRTVQVWDAITGRTLQTYTGHRGFVWSVAWSPNGKLIASASEDGTVQVWDATSGQHIYAFQSSATTVLTAAWSPSGQRIASAGSDGKVQVWDASSGDHLYVYYGHSDFVYTVAWSHDGHRIASAGDDKTVQVWSADDGSDVYVYSGHSNSVRSVAWSPADKYISSASWDKTVQVWLA